MIEIPANIANIVKMITYFQLINYMFHQDQEKVIYKVYYKNSFSLTLLTFWNSMLKNVSSESICYSNNKLKSMV